MGPENEQIRRELEALYDRLPPFEQRLLVLILQKALEKLQTLDGGVFAAWWKDAQPKVAELVALVRHLNS